MLSTNPRGNFLKAIALAIIGSGGLLWTLSGCASLDTGSRHPQGLTIEPYSEILEASYAAADTLAADLALKRVSRSGAMLAASLVNIDNLDESCSLGRVISEQIASRIAFHGFRVLEMKLRQNSVYIKKGQGEFLLSREIQQISRDHDSAFVIVGTYTVAEGGIYVSIRVVDAVDNTIITSCDYQLMRTYQTDSLLSRY